MAVIGEGISFNPDNHFQWVGPMWVNTGTSNFGAQTVPLDLKGYQGVAVFLTETTSSGSSGKWAFAFRSQAGTTRFNIQYNYRQMRHFSMSDSGVYFTNAQEASNSGDMNSSANSKAIPRVIYGLKGVVAE